MSFAATRMLRRRRQNRTARRCLESVRKHGGRGGSHYGRATGHLGAPRCRVAVSSRDAQELQVLIWGIDGTTLPLWARGYDKSYIGNIRPRGHIIIIIIQ
jgi:hypothetical protein